MSQQCPHDKLDTNKIEGDDVQSSFGLRLQKEPARLHFKATVLMLVTVLLVISAFAYLLHARNFFEEKQTLILTSETSEGLTIGMDLTLSGFPIGNVSRLELDDNGKVLIFVDVLKRNAHWLRESSIFTLVRNLFGSTSLKAYTNFLDDPQLPNNAIRSVLYGDATAEIPQIMASANSLVSNLSNLTNSKSDLAASIKEIRQFGTTLNGTDKHGGALKVLLGNGPESTQLSAAVKELNVFLQRLNGIAQKADKQFFGQKGLIPNTNAASQELTQLLQEVRQSLLQVDKILQDTKKITSNVSSASGEFDTLKTDVESKLKQIDVMLNQLQNRWPFHKDNNIHLP